LSGKNSAGWEKLVNGYPWFQGKGLFPLPAYSEFMPPPRFGRSPYGQIDTEHFMKDDPFGWYVSEIEEELELQPGLSMLANQILRQIVELGLGKPAYAISSQKEHHLIDNPYWPPELAAQAGKLPHERYVVFLPLALSKTQDDKGRIRWTFFGSSEQGPERAFWKSFFSSPTQEIPAQEALAFLFTLFSQVYRETCGSITGLRKIGFRFLPTPPNPSFPYWTDMPLPSYIKPFIWEENTPSEDIRYLLTFRPFSLLPPAIRERYLNGQLVILPFPGSLVFWGMPGFVNLQKEMPMAMQLFMQRLAARHGGPHGIRVPQSGRFHEQGTKLKLPEVEENLLLNTYKRTSRWDRTHRYENELIVSAIEDKVANVLFSTKLDVMGLYNKPMAKNCQLWTSDPHVLLDGPTATREALERAANIVAEGGTFRYRFQFPAMRVGLSEIYWQRPLAAWWDEQNNEVKTIENSPLGYLTAYGINDFDIAHPVELWPRLRQREAYLTALHNFGHLEEHYTHQTTLNILRVMDAAGMWPQKYLPAGFTRQMLHLQEHETLEEWLTDLPEKAKNTDKVKNLCRDVEACIEPVAGQETPKEKRLKTLTYQQTAARTFEEAWWNDILKLSSGAYLNKDNADCVHDPATQAHLEHHHRDLEKLGNYLLGRHREAIDAAGMAGKAICGELPFHWETDFDFSDFGGWKNNQEGHSHERDLLVIIPGKNRKEAIILGDHYDTAYMEDVYNKSAGGTGARLAAHGADDNGSATATLLQAAPVFLKLSKDGLLERDVWLVHLTGEEFPADCMGARYLAQALIEKTLQMRLTNGQTLDLSGVQVMGVYLMDMIGHNRESDWDIFQISPGKGPASLRLAWEAYSANQSWNMNSAKWNLGAGRFRKGRGRRSDDDTIPVTARFPNLNGEVRLPADPRSTLFNTDGQIFSDCGIPVVLFMENYDINRSGYHDTKDTMQNIDLDFGAALAAIVIESVARAAALKKI
jgi:hypothetical protein